MTRARGAVEALKLVDVTRRFGKTTALANLSLTIPGGSFVTLLGPSGCGKSTALNCIAGLDRPTSGEILLNGERVDHLPAEARGFGMVFQSYALFPHLNVEKNVAFGLAIRGVPKNTIKTKVSEALRMMRLSGLEERQPWQLSGGQQQRLAFARAVVLEPRLLLLDEPLSNLDAKLREELKSEIKGLHDRLGITTIHVTHDQAEAMAMSDLVVVMRAGRVEQAGTPQEIYNRPASLFVADFMGYGNRLVRGREVTCFRAGDVVVDARAGDYVGRVRRSEFLGKRYAVEAVLSTGESVRFHHPEALPHDREVRLAVPRDRLMVYPAETPNA